ncbi:MAG: GntR family transcriptional regulator [Betaproteobacteria bacterium]|nr:GntR family transcriptional regulator [Betaproteobacteria bacterium]
MPTHKPAIARKPKPGASRASRGDHAYRKLFESIETGVLKPGTRLREVELSTWVGASRTPVREALGRLESDGLIARDPSRGMIVAELDPGMVAELYDMREVLEGTAAGLAARHASEAEIDTLREIAQRDREVGADPMRLARINRLFHEALLRSAHNRFLVRSVNALRQSMVLLGRTTLAIAGRPEAARAEHDAIVQAIARHDAEAAAAAARAHIRAAYRARLGLMLDD